MCSFNTHVQELYYGGNTSQKIDQYLTNQKYDIALLLEWLNNEGTINNSAYPYQKFISTQEDNPQRNYGLKLVSKYPILNCERIRYDHNTRNLAVFVDVDIDG